MKKTYRNLCYALCILLWSFSPLHAANRAEKLKLTIVYAFLNYNVIKASTDDGAEVFFEILDGGPIYLNRIGGVPLSLDPAFAEKILSATRDCPVVMQYIPGIEDVSMQEAIVETQCRKILLDPTTWFN